MRRLLVATVVATTVSAGLAGAAQATTFTATAPLRVSGPSPFAPGCGGPGEAAATSFNYLNAEVEPWVAVNPANPANIVGFWQQDRWSDGGAHGLVAGVSKNGGLTWTATWPAFSRCAGAGPGDPGYFERSSDPVVSFSPNGDLYAISLSFDNSTARNAVLVAKSTDGGTTWQRPLTLRFDNPRAIGNNFNDKESLTADPGDSRFAYAVWDRIVSPSERASASGYEHGGLHTWRGPTWFARTTDGGRTWEPARPIYDPGQRNQTISNQIVVTPDGTLVNGFQLLKESQNNHGTRGLHIAAMRSTDKGATWSTPVIVAPDPAFGTRDPEPRVCRTFNPNPCLFVRTGDIVPDFAVDRTGGPNNGTVYAVWQEHSTFTVLGAPVDDVIMLSRSADAGRTWSRPVRVNQTPAGVYNRQASTAAVHVRANGDVAVTYYDMRNDVAGDAALSTDLWIAHSHDAGRTWDAETHLSGPYDMRTAPYAGGYFVGDYEGLDSVGNVFESLFVQTNAGAPTNRTDVFIATAS
jgi:hypothetical protein